MSINPPGNSLESQGGLHSSASQALMCGQIFGSLFKCRFGFKRAGVGPAFSLFLPGDVDVIVYSMHFSKALQDVEWGLELF